ncbi:MAG: ThuA domain-containing protein, partial [Planctomycetota bacterium]
MSDPIRILIWNEARWDRKPPHVQEIARATYPDGMNAPLAAGLRQQFGPDATVSQAVFDDPEHGLDEASLERTDVLVWWGHNYHRDVDDAAVDRVCARVRAGMGFVPLHSAHMSKPFTRLLGTSGQLGWRNVGEREIIWFIEPGHPLCVGFD